MLGGSSPTAIYNVDSCLAEVEDLLSYCNDILCTGDTAWHIASLGHHTPAVKLPSMQQCVRLSLTLLAASADFLFPVVT